MSTMAGYRNKKHRPSHGYVYETTMLVGQFHCDDMRVFAANGQDGGGGGEGVPKFELPPGMGKRKSFGREGAKRRTWLSKLTNIRLHKVARLLVEDWFFLAALGVIMAFCSFAMDFAIEHLQELHVTLYNLATGTGSSFGSVVLSYVAWVGFTLLAVATSALLVHYIAPQAIGSGIPEMKTILRGVILKEYLTFRTLVSKMLGLTISLGSGLPIGKEGPFVHVASVVATVLSKLVTSFKGVYANESRNSEMLAAACAVGVACTFSAPVGGVLFSIEVTSVYFAVRNYWRGFFAAACSATVFRLLRVVMKDTEVTVVAFFQTDFPKEAFYPEELPIFAFIGIVCGFAGALFVCLHRTIVLFIRKNQLAKKVFQRHLLIYPTVVSLIVATLTYPLGYGRFIAGQLKFSEAIQDLFSNCTWTRMVTSNTTACSTKLLHHWEGAEGQMSVFVTISCFMVTFFVLGALSNTLPIPAGVFMPVFVVGAAFGRLVGEGVAVWFPEGLRGPDGTQVFPGVYAVVGAAAFSGSVTHTVSVAVIIFELTGQLMYILPVMIAVLIANAICAYIQPSIYDSIIKIKHLPYLPDIPPASSIVHGIRAENIMVGNVKYLSKATTYGELQDYLYTMPRLRAFPIVDDPKSMILLGSVTKRVLDQMLEKHVGATARKAEANSRVRDAIQNADRQFQSTFSVSDAEDEIVADGPERNAANGETSGTRFTVVPVANRRSFNARRSAFSSEAPKICIEGPDDGETSDVEKNKDQPDPTLTPVSLDRKLTVGNSNNNQLTIRSLSSANVYHTIEGYVNKLTRKLSISRLSANHYRNGGMEYDLNDEERREWEAERLDMLLDMDELRIDPAPFQLVECTSLFKVHSLFSLLGLNRAYVTNCGRLVGVVALRELRIALERAQAGLLMSDADVGLTAGAGSPSNAQDANDSDSDDDDNIFQPRLEVVERNLSRQESNVDMSALEEEKDAEAAKSPGIAAAPPLIQAFVVPTINISDETS